MNKKIMLSTSMIATAAIMFSLSSAGWTTQDSVYEKQGNSQKVQLGPRPFFLINDMDAGWLKEAFKL